MNIQPSKPLQPAVHFERIGLRYGRGDEVFSDVSFTLPKGSMTFVTGPSGSGKTSLLRLIDLSLRPSRGLLSILGFDPQTRKREDFPALKRQLGIVHQDYELIEHLDVYENTALPLRVIGQKPQDYHDDIISLLQWVGLGDHMHARPSTLSGGEKQRAAIARAVIAKPKILIADEPTGNVDAALSTRLMRLFFELNRTGTTVIIATHDQTLIPEMAQVLDIKNGQVCLETR